MSKPTVAVAGLNGRLGTSVLEALSSEQFREQYTFPIRALTRDASALTSTDDLAYYQVDYENSASFDQALAGVDVLISVTSPKAKLNSLNNMVDAAQRAGVQVYFNSSYGINYDRAVKFYPNMCRDKLKAHQYAMETLPRVVNLTTGFFSDRVAVYLPFLGIMPDKQLYVQHGDLDNKQGFTTTLDVGRAIASLACRSASELKPEYIIQGDSKSTNDVANLWEKTTGKTLTRQVLTQEEVLLSAAESDAKPDEERGMTDFMNIMHGFMAQPSNPVNNDDNDNEVVNTGGWEWTTFEDLAETAWGS